MTFNFIDWPSIEANLISDVIFLIITVIATPLITIIFIRWRNRKSLVVKFSHILLEFCDFLSYTNYRDNELNAQHINIFTKRRWIKEYKFVAICIVNVFSPLVYPKQFIVIHAVHEKDGVAKSYEILKNELERMKELRLEIEQILSAHALHLDEKILLEISQLCFKIRKLEITHKNNVSFEELSKSLGSDMTGVFGLKEVDAIYQSIFKLIKEILSRNYFDYQIVKGTE